MPIYEYECSECGRYHEAMQKMSDAPMSKCPHCSGRLHKLISHSTFHLKGSGWYATDYANRNTGSSDTSSHKPDQKSDNSVPASDSGSSSAGE